MACSMCHGTDVQEYCDQGQCYWQEMQRQEEERNRQLDEEYRREMERSLPPLPEE